MNVHFSEGTFRSSCLVVTFLTRISENLRWSLIFNRAAGLQPETLLKRKLQFVEHLHAANFVALTSNSCSMWQFKLEEHSELIKRINLAYIVFVINFKTV